MGNALGVDPLVNLRGHAHRAKGEHQAGDEEVRTHANSLSKVAQLKLTRRGFTGFFLRSHVVSRIKLIDDLTCKG